MKRIGFFYLTSFGTSLLGNSITAIALPLLVLFTTGSPLGAGAVAIAASVPSAIAGLVMGSLIDRINRRTAAILSDVISAVALLVLPIIDMTIGLHLGWFIAVAILNSFGDVPGITAREAMVPAIARAAEIAPARLIGLRESLGGVALLIGPALAGILVAALEPVTVLWVTAGIAALAALLTLFIPGRAAAHERDAAPAAEAPKAGSVLEGMLILFRSPLLRTIRYYHQAGVLAEPPRRTNGYRVYTVDHLVALLRIRQLTESGLSLARAGAVVADSDAASGEDALDEVDRALEARIAVLTEQRRKLAEARSGRHVGLSRLAAALAVKPTDAPLAILLAHLYRDDPQAEQLADTLLSPALRSELVSLQDRFDDIDEDTPESDLDDLGEAVRRIITSISEHLSPLESEQPHLVQALADREMNDRQRSFMRRFD